jgi:hypothetical protein
MQVLGEKSMKKKTKEVPLKVIFQPGEVPDPEIPAESKTIDPCHSCKLAASFREVLHLLEAGAPGAALVEARKAMP